MSTVMLIGVVLTAVAACMLVFVVQALRRRRVFEWLPGLLSSRARRRRPDCAPVHVMFCFVDHFEPRWGRADYATECARVKRWCEEYPRLCAVHRDADGKPPRHTFFYPEEEYRPEHMRDLVALCREGFGEIEIHLHHDNDTADGLREKLRGFVGTLDREYGALPLMPDTGRAAWAFVHGNWALDNSRPDGRWCGVNDELTVLAEEGCYADFTLPSVPDATQTSTVNSIYYATDDPARPKSHDTGTPVRVGGKASGHLMIIQGPLGLNWRWRKLGVLPRIENADVRRSSPPRPDRTDLWIRTGIHVEGRRDWVFVKVHTHGTQERDIDTVLGPPTDALFRDLETRYNDGARYVLHYVTAREMYNIVKAAEAGHTGNPGDYRDFSIPAPTFRVVSAGRKLTMEFIFWLAVALVAYSYLIYPLLMLAIGRLCQRELAAQSFTATHTPSVAVIVAAYNEERHIAARIGNLLQLDYPENSLTIHVGSDGSSDRTVAIANEVGGSRVRVSSFVSRRGKASVLNDLIASITDEIVVFTDANTEFRPDAIRELVRHFSDPRVGAVSGELKLHDPIRGDNQDSSYWRLETVLKRGESYVGGLLGANGGIYAIRRALFRPLPADTVIDDFTIVMDISALSHRTVFEPAALAFEDVPHGIDDEFRRRVRIGIGNYQAFFRHPEYLLRATWVRRFTYFSHKVLEWFTPHLLILALIMSAALAERPLFAALLATQVAGYALLAIGLVLRSRFELPRFASAPLFVFALNIAFLVGFWRYIRGDFAGHWRRTERT